MDPLAQATVGFRAIDADAALKDQALKYLRQWLTEPDFAAYRPQLHWLIEQQQWAGLLDRFYQILPFGTGGRRGAVGIGPNRMNLWTLGASVQGHCEYFRQRFPGVERVKVVLAYDVRQFEDKRRHYNPDLPNPVLHLSSKDLAHHAAGIYAANGIHAFIPPPNSKRFLATPELSFTIRWLAANGGLNISASHNPPDDNGGKFYDERGGQPIPPDDQIMADLVEQVTLIKQMPFDETLESSRIHLLEDYLHRDYIELSRKQSLVEPPRLDEIKIVFTPLHGVGAMTAMEALVRQGYRVIPVAEQMTPDGQFPNVTQTPNPEVPASMDRAAKMAAEHNADLVLATDPDADRLGAMIPDRQGGYRYVTGNEIAALLTYYKLTKLSQRGELPRSPIVIKTEVTTNLISRIARHFKTQLVDNLLVGFKYIADVLWHLELDGEYEDVRGTPEDFIIACEESHGILLDAAIRDKDAAGAAVLLADLALDQKRHDQTVLDYLDALYRRFGYFRNEGHTVVMTGIQGKQDMAHMLDTLRKSPLQEIGGLKVTSFEDLRDERGRLGAIKGATDFASRNFLIFRMGDEARIAVRPSGTEPKAKTYVEVGSPPYAAGASNGSWQQLCATIDEQTRRLAADFQQKAMHLAGLESSRNR